MPRVLLSSSANADIAAIRESLAEAGFTIVPHVLASAPAIDFTSLAVAVVDVGERIDLATSQTRRWRLELGDHVVPVLWLLTEASSAIAFQGFENGADACLPRNTEPAVLAAQVKALARTQASAARLELKAGESLLLGEQLRKAHSQLEREYDLARRIHRGSLPAASPEIGDIRLSVVHRPLNARGGDFHDIRRLDEHHIGFFLGDVLGRGASLSLLGVLVKQAAVMKEITGDRYRLVPPEESLVEVNRTLIGLGLEESPLVAMLIGSVDARDGSVSIARAGLPAPVFIPASGEVEVWSVPGPFLGTSDTSYSPRRGVLNPGDKVLFASDGAAGESPDPLIQAAIRYRHLSGQPFVDALARELLPLSQHADDFTLMLVTRE
jgi:hypothetical protein